MATESGSGEGQALAHRLLEAINGGQPPDWGAFHGTYRRWLTYVAARCLARNSQLKGEFENPEDLINAFLAEKVLPPRQAVLMLGTPARGECPLRPRLAVSLRNFCVDLLRSQQMGCPRLSSEELDEIEARKEMPLPDYEDVADALARQMSGIRACFPLKQRAPYRVALLLRHRLDWAAVFHSVELPQTEGGTKIELSLPILERLTTWEDGELQTRLGESLLSLSKSWELLRPRLLAVTDQRLSSDDVAGTLHVPRDSWDQWISRGRRRLRQHVGAGYDEEFALWV